MNFALTHELHILFTFQIFECYPDIFLLVIFILTQFSSDNKFSMICVTILMPEAKNIEVGSVNKVKVIRWRKPITLVWQLLIFHLVDQHILNFQKAGLKARNMSSNINEIQLFYLFYPLSSSSYWISSPFQGS